MLSSSYLQKSRNGVYFARFVIPAPQRSPTESRDFKLSTCTKDPRHAKSTARYLRVLFDSYLMENATVTRTSAIAYLQARMKKPTTPPMPFGVKIKGQGFDIELTDLGPEDVGNMDELIAPSVTIDVRSLKLTDLRGRMKVTTCPTTPRNSKKRPLASCCPRTAKALPA